MVVVGAVAAFAFTLSAAVGMGGSLVLVPALVAMLGAKEGVAAAAVLLAANNVVKTAAYRRSLPWRAAGPLMAVVIVGSAVGARVMLWLPEAVVTAAVVAVVASFFVDELRRDRRPHRRDRGANRWGSPSGLLPRPTPTGSAVSPRPTQTRSAAPAPRPTAARWCAFLAGTLSGVSGSSGPLKGVALRTLALDRAHMVGAAALLGLGSDLTKGMIFVRGGLLDAHEAGTLGLLVPVMFASVWLGRTLNRKAGERRFAALFWAVMAGYSARLVLAVL